MWCGIGEEYQCNLVPQETSLWSEMLSVKWAHKFSLHFGLGNFHHNFRSVLIYKSIFRIPGIWDSEIWHIFWLILWLHLTSDCFVCLPPHIQLYFAIDLNVWRYSQIERLSICINEWFILKRNLMQKGIIAIIPNATNHFHHRSCYRNTNNSGNIMRRDFNVQFAKRDLQRDWKWNIIEGLIWRRNWRNAHFAKSRLPIHRRWGIISKLSIMRWSSHFRAENAGNVLSKSRCLRHIGRYISMSLMLRGNHRKWRQHLSVPIAP